MNETLKSTKTEMESATIAKIVFIDDDRLSNMICAKILKVIFPQHMVVSFTNPEKGLAYLEENKDENIVLFLDINMPGMSGWSVLDALSRMTGKQNGLKIYVLSATINSAEMERAESHPLVSAYVGKPLSIELFKTLLA